MCRLAAAGQGGCCQALVSVDWMLPPAEECPTAPNSHTHLYISAGSPQVVLLPVLAGSAIRELFPATAALLRPMCTLCATALMAMVCGSYVAHSAPVMLHAWPQLMLAVCALHLGECRPAAAWGRGGTASRCSAALLHPSSRPGQQQSLARFPCMPAPLQAASC